MLDWLNIFLLYLKFKFCIDWDDFQDFDFQEFNEEEDRIRQERQQRENEQRRI